MDSIIHISISSSSRAPQLQILHRPLPCQPMAEKLGYFSINTCMKNFYFIFSKRIPFFFFRFLVLDNLPKGVLYLFFILSEENMTYLVIRKKEGSARQDLEFVR
jgi:hypothetical protein